MKKISLLNYRFILLFVLAALFFSGCRKEETEKKFPDKPITILVYTGPGGLIDITARKFVDVASNHTDATFVVENMQGSGGIIALQNLLQKPADGYTLFASTKSNISKIISSNAGEFIDNIDWAAMMMADHECIISYKQQAVTTWEEIIADAKARQGDQLWLGPARGGLDHVTALKIWDEVGITAKWIPFGSGGKAVAALLGEQGTAYVGNPSEVLGNDDLHIAAISAPERLERFPDAPIFRDFGITTLDNEYMWRGFIMKKGSPEPIREWYDDLFQKVNADPDWREYWERNGIAVEYKNSEEFTKIVKNDVEQFTHYLSKIGMISTKADSLIAKLVSGTTLNIFILILFLIFISGLYFSSRSPKLKYEGIMIPIFFIMLSLLFYLVTYTFSSNELVGPTVVPRLWIILLIPLNLILIIKNLRRPGQKNMNKENQKATYKFIFLLVLYLAAILYLGYFISTFLFIFSSIYLLGYRKYLTMLIISFGWLVFSYLIFFKLIYVPLPVGKLFEHLF